MDTIDSCLCSRCVKREANPVPFGPFERVDVGRERAASEALARRLHGDERLENPVARRLSTSRERLGYKVLYRIDGRLVSKADRRQGGPARVGERLGMQGRGVFLSPNRDYVLAYYSDGEDAEHEPGVEEVLVTLAFDPADLVSGNLTDREAEATVRSARIVAIEPTYPRLENPSAEELHGPSREIDRDELRGRVEPSGKAGRRMYLGVNVESIAKVREFGPDAELKAVISYVNMKGRPATKYVYADTWTQRKAERKFVRADQMMGELPAIRKRVKKDLKSSDPRTRAAAVVVDLIDSTTIRIGGSSSEKHSGNVGATTLRAENVVPRADGSVDLRFRGKSHVEWDRHITEPALAGALAGFARNKRPSERLFPVDDSDVNGYLREISPKVKITAKDFRTLHASVTVHAALSKLPPPTSPADAERNIKAAIVKASALLGNTPAVCRSTYVNPRVIAAYLARLPS